MIPITHALSKTRELLVIVLSLPFCFGCGSSGDSSPTDPSDFGASNDTSDDLFNPESMIEVNIQMMPEDFAILRAEGRTLASASSECLDDFEFTEFVADVTIDGIVINDVEIRKKGFLGSISRIRPSLKLDFNTFVDDRTYKGMSRMPHLPA